MKYFTPLDSQDKDTLIFIYQTHINHHVRQQAHAILLSNRGDKIPDISLLLESHRDRVSAWIDRWHQEGITDLYDHPRSGRSLALQS